MHNRTSPSLTGLLAFIGLCGASTGAAGQASSDVPLTLVSALETAGANNRLLRSARLRVAEAEGDVTQAAIWLVYNPELNAVKASRSALTGPTSSAAEFEIGLEQRLEIAGQRGQRVRVARADLAATEAAVGNAERVVGLAVALAFYDGLAARERVALGERHEGLAEALLDLAQRRLEAGVGTPLELNAAVVRLAEARRRTMASKGQRHESLIRLRQMMGLDPGELPSLSGALPSVASPVSEPAFVSIALARRPDLIAATQSVEAASATAELAGAEAWPDVGIEASFAREEGSELLQAGIRIPLALFNRNQGARASMRAAYGRATSEREGVLLAVEAETRTAARLYQQAGDALRLYDADVLRAQQESVDLVELAAEAGELSPIDVLVVQRELLDGLMGYLEARLDLAASTARLLAAASLPQTTDLQEGIR